MAEKSALSALSMFLSAKQTYIFQVLPQYFNFVTHAGFKVSMWKQVSKVSPCQSTGKTQGLPGVVPSGWWCRGRSGSELRDGWRSRQSNSDPRSFQQSILMPCWYPYQHHQKWHFWIIKSIFLANWYGRIHYWVDFLKITYTIQLYTLHNTIPHISSN